MTGHGWQVKKDEGWFERKLFCDLKNDQHGHITMDLWFDFLARLDQACDSLLDPWQRHPAALESSSSELDALFQRSIQGMPSLTEHADAPMGMPGLQQYVMQAARHTERKLQGDADLLVQTAWAPAEAAAEQLAQLQGRMQQQLLVCRSPIDAAMADGATAAQARVESKACLYCGKQFRLQDILEHQASCQFPARSYT